MASNIEYVEYVCDQMNGAGDISYKKMFGEYCIYCDLKVIGLVCNNQFFLKQTEGASRLLREVELAAPYTNAKYHFLIESLDDKDYITEVIKATVKELPQPKVKVKKTCSNKLNNL